MAIPQIRLVAFITVKDEHALARRLVELARATDDRLCIDFPAVAKRYENVIAAATSIRQVCRAMRAREGAFGAYAVEVDGVVMGVATFEQRKLTIRRGWKWLSYPKVVANGPMIALWLGTVERPKGLLPRLLLLGAQEMAYNTKLTGQPWTLVRPDRTSVREALNDKENGFGGFAATLGPHDFSRLDGAQGLRTLFVACWTTDMLCASI